MPSFVEPENVVCICECVPEDTNGQVQYQAFESQLRSMREKRGNANAKHLWFGSTTQEILRILTYGFGSAVAPTAGAAFGSGIYLTPQHRPFSRNYLNSGLPRRILYYKRGEWTDFPESAREAIIDGFRHQMPCMFVFFGCELMLVDLLCMVISNSMTKKHASVAWIDEADRCFFPCVSFDGGAGEPSEQVSGVVRQQEYSVPAPQMVTEVIAGDGNGPPAPVANTLNLQRDTEGFAFMEKLFLSGMPSFVKPENVVCICTFVPKDTNAQVQYQAFESQLRSMREKRGNANAKNLWFGSTTQEILRILTYGFGSGVAPTVGAAFGSGIYLTPKHRPFSRFFVLGYSNR
ncbi:Poly(ADP-ribose) polymerase catalytic domain [Musa troglodytarum]|uniref:Poly [ADP-ribose] polymerase n=1 Tax=Musa troglodytarum TaxID=320322 RepID=A0A9E7HDX3_9LILI|nr:Poly(ADP-ribose) polymerase catalytic domain [Musa troglodytarum]